MAQLIKFVLTLLFLTAVIYISANDRKLNILINPIFEEQTVTVSELVNLVNNKLAKKKANHKDFRLPGTTRPLHYTITWDVDPENKVFNGTVEIHFETTKSFVDEIVINSHKINITSLALSNSGVDLSSRFTEDIEHQFLIVKLNRGGMLYYRSENNEVYILSISFSGKVRNDLLGIYQSSYHDNWKDDKLRWLAVTQFEPTEARTAFPCYDEPEYKATFDISIVRPKKYVSWTGTRLKRSTEYSNLFKVLDVFSRTPPMSTYTIGFIVADFDSVSTSTGGNMVYELIGRRGAITHNQHIFAYTLGQKLLNIMNVYTGIDYYSVSPDLKLTHAGVPDFLTGAMENWGLIIYREMHLMYDSRICSDSVKEEIILTMAHEIAHMWFGNLVTCKFWDSAWLNEGFSKYFEYYLADKVYPDMMYQTLFITDILHPGLLADSVTQSHPLTNPNVGNPSSINEMFSAITYNKGAAVIRMTEHLLGSEVFKEGVRKYLNNRYLNTTEPMDLYNALTYVTSLSGALSYYDSNFNLIEYFKSWTEQSGHPLLEVHVNHETGDMKVIQNIFLINRQEQCGKTDKSVLPHWIIPITFTTASNPDFNNTKPSHIMSENIMSIYRGSIGHEWVLFNKQQIGFYRVNYDEHTWDLIIAALAAPNQSNIHEYNKAQIVDDVFQFARSNIMSYSRAFQIISFLVNETDYAPWAAAISNFEWLRNKLSGTSYTSKLDKLIKNLSSKVTSKHGYDKIEWYEGHLKSRLRWMFANFLCSIEDSMCREVAKTKFNYLVDHDFTVNVNDRTWIYCNVLRSGRPVYYNFLWRRYKETDVAAEKHEIIRALGCTSHTIKLNEYLHEMMKVNGSIRLQDFDTAFNSALTGNQANIQVVFKFIQNYWDVYLTSHMFNVTVLKNLANSLRTEEDIQKLLNWALQKKSIIDSYPEITQHVHLARQNLIWAKSVENELVLFFDLVNAVQPSDLPEDLGFPEELPLTAPKLEYKTTKVYYTVNHNYDIILYIIIIWVCIILLLLAGLRLSSYRFSFFCIVYLL